MTTTRESILAQAMTLDPEDRMALINDLLASLEERIDPAIEAAWIPEAEDRLATYRRGELASIPGEEVLGPLDRGGRACLTVYSRRQRKLDW